MMYLKPIIIILYLEVCFVCSRHMIDQEQELPSHNRKRNHRERHSRQINPHGHRQEPTKNNIKLEMLNLLKQIEASLNKPTFYPPYYYPPSAPSFANQQSDILSILQDISLELKHNRLTTPPQIIYVPLPQLPTKCECNCIYGTSNSNVTTESRFKIEEERKWGRTDPIEYDDGISDAFRPVSFEPVPPKRPLSNSSQPVQQASVDSQTEILSNTKCFMPTISCCGTKGDLIEDCFNHFGCASQYDTNTCSKSNIGKILDWYRQTYLST